MKSLSAKYIAAIGLTGILLVGGAVGLLKDAASHESAVASSKDRDEQQQSDTSHEEAHALPMRQWKLGETFVYALDTTRTTTVRGGSQQDQAFRYQVVGTLSLTVIARDQDEIHLRADLVAKDVQASPKVDVDARSWLSNTFYFKALATGAIRSFHFSKDTPVDARMLLKGIVDSFQFIAPSTGSSQWRAVEQDTSGQFTAKYEIEDGQNIAKTKNFYVQMRGPGGLMPIPQGTSFTIMKSTASFTLDASGWPSSVAQDESLEVQAVGMRVLGGIKTQASLSRIESHPEWAGALPADLESDTISEAAAMAASLRQADINMVGGRSFAQIVAELGSDNKSARSQAQARMSALFRVDPSEANDRGSRRRRNARGAT